MKRRKRLLLFLSALIACITPDALSLSDIVIESYVGGTTFGFHRSREESDSTINNRILPEVFMSVSAPLLERLIIKSGYRYSSIIQSQLFATLGFVKKNIGIEAGFNLGFFNEFPIIAVPGISGKATLQVLRKLSFTIYGNTSFYLHPLFALSSRDYNFDQNLFGYSSAFQYTNVRVGYSYEKESLYIKTSDTTYTNSMRKFYEMNIETRFEDFWMNSHTGFGGEFADFSTQSVHQRILGIYIDEIVIITVKKVELSIGLKTYILRLPLKDLADLSVPSSFSWSVSAGIKFVL